MGKKTLRQRKEREAKTQGTAKAICKYLRISPRKVRLVIDAIRRKPVYQAQFILAALNKKAARMTEKVLKSAVANAKVLGLDESRLFVSDVRADGGPTFKRFLSRSMGRADRILKRTTHLSLVVKESEKKFRKDLPEAESAGQKDEGKTKAKKKTASKKLKAAKTAK